MTLSDICEALQSNSDLTISLLDDLDKPVVIFNAAGYSAIDADLLAKTVKRIKVNSGASIFISIEPTTSATDPDAGTTDPGAGDGGTTDPTGDP